MANELIDGVWRIDTAGAALVSTELETIAGLRWVGTAGGAGGVEVEDADGNVVWASRTGAGEVAQESALPTHLRLEGGFAVPTLLAGTVLYLYRNIGRLG